MGWSDEIWAIDLGGGDRTADIKSQYRNRGKPGGGALYTYVLAMRYSDRGEILR